jgi:hypothetical protein
MTCLAPTHPFIASARQHSCFFGHRPTSNTRSENYIIAVFLPPRISEWTFGYRSLCDDSASSSLQRYCIAEANWDAAQGPAIFHSVNGRRVKSLEGKFAEGYH